MNSVSEELWKPVVGFEDRYEVSCLGFVRRIGALKTRATGKNARGYDRIGFRVNGKMVRFSVHSMVAAAFIGPRLDGMTINHIDGNKENNAATNLEYLSAGDNNRHARRVGLNQMNGWLKPMDVERVRSLKAAGVTQVKIAAEMGVTEGAISRLLNGKTWVWF